MKRGIYAGLLAAGLFMLTSCTPSSVPTYSQVTQETLDVLETVAAMIPSHGAIEQTPEFEPYGCNDPVLSIHGRGAFYTGQWKVAVPDGFDVSRFIDDVPTLLGDGWEQEDLGVPVKEPYAYLVRKSPRMTLSLSQTTLNGQEAIELLAISRCGIEEPAR